MNNGNSLPAGEVTCTLELLALPVHYALRAFLAARGPSTSLKKYSVLYFFTPVRPSRRRDRVGCLGPGPNNGVPET